jgi:alpha-ribazole phosphatase/probable phosphoglycerate mutase
MKLLLVRHGEILSNTKKIYAGKSKERLTDRGIYQVHEVAGKLKGRRIHALYTSPIQRAIQTAEIIGNVIGKEYVIEDNFREMELGPWEGLSEEKIPELYPHEWEIWQKCPDTLNLPGRETLEELLNRVLTGVRQFYDKIIDQTLVVVTHVAIIRVLLLWHAQKSLKLYKQVHVPNAEIFEVRIDTKYLF